MKGILRIVSSHELNETKGARIVPSAGCSVHCKLTTYNGKVARKMTGIQPKRSPYTDQRKDSPSMTPFGHALRSEPRLWVRSFFHQY